jgi:hypothetical protein
VIFLLAAVWPLLLGFLLARALGRDLGLALQLSLGAGLGMGVLSCCYFLELETGVAALWYELPLAVGLALACWRIGWRRRTVSRELGWPAAVLGVVLLAGVYGFCAQTSANPQGGWDGWAIWNLHARFLATPYWRDLFSPALLWSHPDYPLLLPGFIARVWSSLGERDPLAPAMAAFLFTFATAGLVGASVAALRNRRQGLLAALFLAGTPAFVRQGASQYADVPVSFFILAALALLALRERSWPEGRGLAVLAGLAAGMAAWTKNEGLLLVVLLAPIQAVGAWRRRGARAVGEQTAWFAAGLAPILALVLFFRFAVAPPNQNFNHRSAATLLGLLLDPHRWTVMAVELAKGLLRFGGLPVGVALLLAAYLAMTGIEWGSPRASLAVTLATLALLLAGYSVICVISPFEIRWQTDTALVRLLAQLWPATVFLGFLAARVTDA